MSEGKIMNNLLIIADDLTGAMDTGVCFAEKGICTRVVLRSGDFLFNENADYPPEGVLVVNSDTRHSAADEAYEKVFAITRRAVKQGFTCVYKKTDSALRGNVGSEIQAVKDALNCRCIAFAPSYPEMNRITSGGIHYIDGVPAAESDFGRDPCNPVKHSAVSEIIAETSDVRCVSGGCTDEEGVCIHDAAYGEELRRIAEFLADSGVCAYAGCSGFANALAEQMTCKTFRSEKISLPDNLLCISGSMNPRTLRQCRAAVESGFRHYALIDEEKLCEPKACRRITEKFREDAGDGMKGFCAVLDTADSETVEANSWRICENLAMTGAEILRECENMAVLCTGGDTLAAFLKAAGAAEMIPLKEVFPGTVMTSIMSGGKRKYLFTKSGGFGEEDLFCRLAEIIKENDVNKPVIGISMGDPFGNGAEITVKALMDENLRSGCRSVVIGDYSCMKKAAEMLLAKTGNAPEIRIAEGIDDCLFSPGTIDVLDMGYMKDEDDFSRGACPEGGEAAFGYVRKLIEMAMEGKIDATVTNAISKEAIRMAGHDFSGHTEIYAHYTGTDKYTMMLAHESFRVVHVSTHVSLREACDRVKKDRVLEVIRLADETCRSLGISRPRIAVAGLNPHCGENGLFGQEEIREIQPAIDAALKEGIHIPDRKPLPPDSVFSKAIGGLYDIVVAMYHDQGHIPVKVRGFVYDMDRNEWKSVSGVNITLGLPIIRTSVDHGTGFDRAWEGTSSPDSLINAVSYAAAMADDSKNTSK